MKIQTAGFFALVFLATVTAQAGISEFGLGLSSVVPMGNNYQLLNSPLGYQGEVWIDGLPWIGRYALLRLSLFDDPFVVRSSLTNMNVNLFGGFAELQVNGGKSLLGLKPFISPGIGLAYDSLGFSSGTSVENAATAFGLRINSGFDLPIWGGLGALVEFPVSVFFFKTTLATWSPTFSLRWEL